MSTLTSEVQPPRLSYHLGNRVARCVGRRGRPQSYLGSAAAAAEDNSIRPFTVSFPRRRLTSFAGALKPRDGLSANW